MVLEKNRYIYCGIFQKKIMKKLGLIALAAMVFACSKNDNTITSEEVNLFIDHYKTTSILSGTALVVQEGNAIGSSEYSTLGGIQGFDFVPGFTYNLTAKKTIVKNDGTDAKTASYELISIDDVGEIAQGETFNVPLGVFVNGRGFVPFVVRTADSTFVLSNEIQLDCRAFCDELEYNTTREQQTIGVFKHDIEGGYILLDLII